MSPQIPEAWGTVKVTARGAGYAILQMSVQYNVDIARFVTPPPQRCFSLVSTHHFYGRNQSHIEFQGCARYSSLTPHIVIASPSLTVIYEIHFLRRDEMV